MKYKYFFIIILIFTIACNKYDGPFVETTESYNFSKAGNEQKTFVGDYFSDSIRVYLYSINGKYPEADLSAKFTIVAGGGSVDNNNINFKNNYVSTKWKSGNSGGRQQVRIDIIVDNNEILNSIFMDAYAFRENVWDTVTTEPINSIQDIIADTIAKQTLMISNCRIYKQDTDYFNWLEQNNPVQNCPFSLDIDNNGTIYLSGWSGDIYKSTNGGNSWLPCTKPIEGHPYYYYMTVTPAGYIWASSPEYEYSLHCSRNGGQTWSKDTIGLQPKELIGDIFRLGNGDILFYSLNMHLYKSTDDGKSWESMQSPEYSTKLYVTDNDEIIMFNQENGLSIHKSTDLGQTYTKVYNVMPEYGTSMSKIIQKWKGVYYILIPGYGIIKTVDFENFETFWRNTDIVFLYMDHSGVLIAKEMNSDTAYYYKISD